MNIRSFVKGMVLTLAVFATHFSHAEFINTCVLEGEIRLSETTQIICQSTTGEPVNLTVAPGTRIITNGQSLAILTTGNLILPTQTLGGLSIQSFDSQSAQEISDARQVSIFAQTASGYLQIDNRGQTADGLAGDVSVEFVTLSDFDQDIHVDEFTHVELILNGYTAASLGETHKFGELEKN